MLTGHPSGLSRDKSENIRHLQAFLRLVADYREAGKLEAKTVSRHCETVTV